MEPPPALAPPLPVRLQAILVAAIVAATAGVMAYSISHPAVLGPGEVSLCSPTAAQHIPAVGPERARPVGLAGPTGPVPLQAVPVLLDLDNETNWSVAASYCYAYNVDYAAPQLVVGGTAFEVKTDSCQPISETVEIQFLTPDGAVLASENLTSHTWSAGSSAYLTAKDTLLISSSGPLTGDELDSNVTGYVDGGTWSEEQGLQIGPSQGAWEGCEF